MLIGAHARLRAVRPAGPVVGPLQLSDRMIVMDEGRKIAEGPGDVVRNDPKVIEACLGHGPGRPTKEMEAAE